MSIVPSASSITNDKTFIIDDKIALATKDIETDNNNVHYISKQLKQLYLQQSEQNTITICDYIISLVNESNPVPHYKKTQIQLLCYLSSHLYDKQQRKQKKLFSEMTRDDIIGYLNKGRKSEAEDPMHRWIGTYNVRRVNLIRFFKWLYYPNILPSKARPVPDVVKNIPRLKRKEISTVKPTDLWTEEDDYIFLKYCPSPRDRCYHTVSRDISARPSEILNLRIKDIVFRVASDGTNRQYAEVTVNGKTGVRQAALINSIPYVKEWINIHHPQRGNPNAYFIPTLDKRYQKYGYKMSSSMSLYHIYKNYKLKFFPKLLSENSEIPEEDKQKIERLLRKPWNPYIRRHSALTQKAQTLTDNTLKQHAGWSGRSQMNLKYVHFYSNESINLLLKEHGITPVNKDPKTGKEISNLINKKLSTPKQCPNCTETNTIDSKFCVKCKMILTYDAYAQITEEKQQEKQRLQDLESKLTNQQKFQEIQSALLQIIAETMRLHQNNFSNKNIVRYFKKGDPKYDPELNTEKYNKIPVEAKIQAFKEIRKEQQHVIQDVILPAVNDISKYMLTEPDKAKEVIKKVFDNELFQFYHCWGEEDYERYVNERDPNKMVDIVIDDAADDDN